MFNIVFLCSVNEEFYSKFYEKTYFWLTYIFLKNQLSHYFYFIDKNIV